MCVCLFVCLCVCFGLLSSAEWTHTALWGKDEETNERKKKDGKTQEGKKAVVDNAHQDDNETSKKGSAATAVKKSESTA